jgi:5'-3' exoribonuclease 1
MPNHFSARERAFIAMLAQDLHLAIRWDEYDEEDVNLVTWRFMRPPTETSVHGSGGRAEIRTASDGGEGEWVDVEEEEDDDDDDDEEADEEEEEESRAAVDRVLKKYDKAQVVDDDRDGEFDARHERSTREKMDEWKRGYYKVRLFTFGCCLRGA